MAWTAGGQGLPRALACPEGGTGGSVLLMPLVGSAATVERPPATATSAPDKRPPVPSADLTLDVRHMPIGCRDAAILPTLCAMEPRRTVLVVSDADLHALALDLEMTYPGKFVVRLLRDGRGSHCAVIGKVGRTPPSRAPWEAALASSWSAVRDP